MVAYEALRADPDLRVEMFVTLGSPLGMPRVVFDGLDPAPGPGGRAAHPAGVARWVNIADIGDPVAVPVGGLQPLSTAPSKTRPTVIALFDPHTAKSYLGCAPLTAALTPYQPGERHVMTSPQHRTARWCGVYGSRTAPPAAADAPAGDDVCPSCPAPLA